MQGLLDWEVFNALIGNADAHAKNLPLLCDRDGRLRLAPLYDLVPTGTLSKHCETAVEKNHMLIDIIAGDNAHPDLGR